MPPRYAYWTILIGDEPTAFRAGAMEDIMPTFNRLKEKQPTAMLKWFQNGKLWTSRIEAREAMAFRGDKGRRSDPRHQPGVGVGGWRGKPAIADDRRPPGPKPQTPSREHRSKPEWKAENDARPEWKPKGESFARGPKPEWKPRGDDSRPAWKAKSAGASSSPKPSSFAPSKRTGASADRQAPSREHRTKPEWKPKERGYSPSAKPGWKPSAFAKATADKKSAARPEWKPRGDDSKPAWKPKSASASSSPPPSASLRRTGKPSSFAPSKGTGASADRQAPSREHRSKPEWKPRSSARPADAPTGRPDPRDKKWRPGGDHKDPRQKYKDAKKAKWTRFKQAIRARSGHKKKREDE